MSIPGWCDFEDLYRQQVARIPDGALAHFVECGTYYGLSAVAMARLLRDHPRKLILFDTWDDWRGVPEAYRKGESPAPEAIEGAARQHLATFDGLVKLHTGNCLYDAPQHYADGSLDFVFLDDDHTAGHLLAECLVWWPKVKAGGTLAGHDTDWSSVQEGLRLWALMGGPEVTPVSVRSWQVVKS